MTAPRRLLEGSLTGRERRALSAGRTLAPSRAARARMWKGIDAGLAAASVLSVSETAASAAGEGGAKLAGGATTAKVAAGASGGAKLALGGSTSLALGKLLLTWSLVGGALGLGVKLVASDDAPGQTTPPTLQQHTPVERPHSHSTTPTPGTAAAARPERSSGTEAPVASAAQPSRSVGSLPSERTTPTSFTGNAKRSAGAGSSEQAGTDERALEEESALLAQARAHLREGDVQSCLGILSHAERRYPSSVLSQEREALKIEALARVGQREQARKLADDFARHHPDSPHVDRVQELVR